MIIIPAIYKNNVKYSGSSSSSNIDIDKFAQKVELTQAEYNALDEKTRKNGTVYYITDADASSLDIVTKLDSTVTDNQVPSAKVVYDLIENNEYEEVASGDANMLYEQGKTKTYIVMPANKDNIVNLPNTLTSGFTMISISNSGCHQFIFTSKNEIYKRNGSYNGTTVTFNNPWQRVCTTTVADVGKTTIEFDESNLGLTIIDNKSYYKVINGICYGVVEISVNAPITDMNYGYVAINTNDLPKIGFSAKSILNVVEASSSITLVLDETTTAMKLHGNILAKEGTYIVEGSFCYPVAES